MLYIIHPALLLQHFEFRTSVLLILDSDNERNLFNRLILFIQGCLQRSMAQKEHRSLRLTSQT